MEPFELALGPELEGGISELVGAVERGVEATSNSVECSDKGGEIVCV